MPAPLLSPSAINPLQAVNTTPVANKAKIPSQDEFAQVLRQQAAQQAQDRKASSVKEIKEIKERKEINEIKEIKETQNIKDTKVDKASKSEPKEHPRNAPRADGAGNSPSTADNTAGDTAGDTAENSTAKADQTDVDGGALTAVQGEFSGLDLANMDFCAPTVDWSLEYFDDQPLLAVVDLPAVNTLLRAAQAATEINTLATLITGGPSYTLPPEDGAIPAEQLARYSQSLQQLQLQTPVATALDANIKAPIANFSHALLASNADVSAQPPVITPAEILNANHQPLAAVGLNSNNLGNLIIAGAGKFAGEAVDLVQDVPEDLTLVANSITGESQLNNSVQNKWIGSVQGICAAGNANEAKTFLQLRFNQQTLAHDLAEKTGWMIEHKLETAQLQLDPPELGPIAVKIHTHQDQVSVSFIVNNQQVREAMDQTLQRLKEMLQDQGVMLAHADVNSQQQQRDGQANAKKAEQMCDDGDADTVQTLEVAEPEAGIDHFV